MVKVRAGSQKGRTKLTNAGRRRAKRHSHVNTGRVPAGSVRAPGVVRANWDTKKTRTQNMRRLGLACDVNEAVAEARQDTAVVASLQALASRGEAKVKPRAAPGEIRFVRTAVAKHGRDYHAIARDIQTNYFQWTPAQVRRKVELVVGLGLVDDEKASEDEA